MTAPAADKRPVEKIAYRGFHPFLFSLDEDVRATVRGRTLDMRDESRVLHLAKDLYDRTRRWASETNRKGEAAAYLDFTNLQVAARERASFMPRDRLMIEVDRHEDLYNPDPIADTGSSGKLPTGTVFKASTDLKVAVANFDLVPFVEAFVRRLSATSPEYVWQVGEHHYYRTNGYLYQDGLWVPRRFPVPKQVVQAFGPIPPVAPAACLICGKEDDKVAPTTNPKIPHAHNECLQSGKPPMSKEEIQVADEVAEKEANEAGKLRFRIGGP